MSSQVISDARQDKAIRLFTYLKELTELNSKRILTTDQFERVLWLADIPSAPSIKSVFENNGDAPSSDEIWLEIRKPKPLTPPPPCPADLVRWVRAEDIENSILSTLELLDSVPRATDPAETIERDAEDEFDYSSDYPELQDALNRYVSTKWLPWAEQDRIEQKIKIAYDTLFAIYQTQQRSGELFEIVLGVGLLTWQPEDAEWVQRHLVTVPATVQFDPVAGSISLVSGPDGAEPTLEQDMIEPERRPDPREEQRILALLGETADWSWDKACIATALTGWVHAVSAEGQYRDDPLPLSSRSTSSPIVQFAPALILRKRSDRSLLRFLGEAIEQLEETGVVPEGLVDLIEISEEVLFDEELPEDEGYSGYGENEVYFPLEANEEQMEILNRLSRQQGVLVQGPPGTGKSHTIANLISHLLATGQRVLVTSHTPRALRVLKDKIPDEIQSLCVSLVGVDKTAVAEVEASVIGITNRFEHYDAKRQTDRIAGLEQQLDSQRRSNAITQNQLRALRERGTYQHLLGFGNYEGTAQQIAQRLAAEDEPFGWIPDPISESAETPLTNREALRLLEMYRYFDEDRLGSLEAIGISSEEIPLPDEFDEFVLRETRARELAASLAELRSHPDYKALRSLSRLEQDEIKLRIEELHESFLKLRDGSPDIAALFFDALNNGEYRNLRHLQVESEEGLSHLMGASSIARSSVVGVEGFDRNILKRDATARLAHFRSGGGKGNLLSRPKVVKDTDYLERSVFIDGTACGSEEGLQNLLLWIGTEQQLDSLRTKWNPYEVIAKTSISGQISELQRLSRTLLETLALWGRRDALFRDFEVTAGSSRISWESDRQLQELLNILEAIEAEELSTQSTAAYDRAMAAVLRNTDNHPVSERLAAAVRNHVPRDYHAAFAALTQIDQDRALQELQDQITDRLVSAAPLLVASLRSTCDDPIWDERMEQFAGAWNHARASDWMKSFEQPGRLTLLLQQLETGLEIERATLKQLSAELAWLELFKRMTRAQSQHLRAWSLAVRKIGKGTGKYAAIHRQHAREHMEACRPAIPAWIMPMYRVTETLRPQADSFDVVIIDEASQSGPEALFLQYIAKKIVVVGDDKQIAPSSFMDQEAVNTLRRRRIADLPHNETLGVNNSFFDQAVIRYAGRVQLREHFRCMPEIIQFSNNLSYSSSPLIPLRQYGSDRLEPVRTTYVRDGYESTNPSRQDVNIPEADAIVRQIVQCCSDPQYEGKTMGVITLLGNRQHKVIEERLIGVLSPEEINRRRLDCGGPYDFQGDERDVIFLSMVVSPAKEGEKPKPAQTTESAKRLFNVAASRARDQLWLFHSVTLNDLRNPEDVRRRLLEYCLNPHVESASFDFPAGSSEVLVPPFESMFEQDTYLRIRQRGYRVLPQVKVGGYRIDLVVEGLRGRVAVECDGDRWHGPEQYDYDMGRQRQLERAGWTFWRVSGSDFYRDPEQALSGLWKVLDRLGIHPDAQSASKSDAVVVSELDDPSINDGNGPRALSIDESEQDNWIEDRTEAQRFDDLEASVENQELPDDFSLSESTEDDTERSNEHHPLDPLTGRRAPTSQSPLIQEVIDFDEIIPPPSPTRLQIEIEELVLDFDTESKTGATTLVDRYADVARSFMIPYQHWVPRALQDPYDRPAREIIDELLEIINIEGPILCRRVFDLYADAAGFENERQIRSVLNSALHNAYTQRRVEYADEWAKPGQIDDILRSPGRSRVRVRAGGGRKIHELPPSEVAEFIHLVAEECEVVERSETYAIFDGVLIAYGIEVEPTDKHRADLWELIKKGLKK